MQDYIVETKTGKVRGHACDGMVNYLGIPYAEPPVGPLRFKRSVPKTPWEGEYDAKEYSASPVQYNNGKVIGSEDCLTINIQCPTEGEKLPVFVWIYGGGYNTGESNDDMYRGEAFVKDGIVFCSFNYRTNILGFYDFTTYPGCEDFDSNCGLSDQILALHWIHDNIAAFGGDPDRITIGGESAGGASVVNMLVVPSVRGCFQQAIIESALPNCVMTHQMARRNIDLFLEGMHWKPEEMAAHLKQEDPHIFLFGHEYVQANHQYRNPGIFLPGPVIDDLLPVRPIDALRAGAAADIRVIIGTNMHEGTMFVHPENTGFPNNWTMITQMMESNGHADALPQMIAFYHEAGEDYFKLYIDAAKSLSSSLPPLNSDVRQVGGDAFIRFATDYAFEMPAVKVALAQRMHTKDIWMYRFELVTQTGLDTGWKASHAFELPAVFIKPNHEFSRFQFEGEDPAIFDDIARDMHGDWVSFITTGNPNADWDRFDGVNSPVRIYDRNSRTETLDRTHLMQVWGDMRFYES